MERQWSICHTLGSVLLEGCPGVNWSVWLIFRVITENEIRAELKVWHAQGGCNRSRVWSSEHGVSKGIALVDLPSSQIPQTMKFEVQGWAARSGEDFFLPGGEPLDPSLCPNLLFCLVMGALLLFVTIDCPCVPMCWLGIGPFCPILSVGLVSSRKGICFLSHCNILAFTTLFGTCSCEVLRTHCWVNYAWPQGWLVEMGDAASQCSSLQPPCHSTSSFHTSNQTGLAWY